MTGLSRLITPGAHELSLEHSRRRGASRFRLGCVVELHVGGALATAGRTVVQSRASRRDCNQAERKLILQELPFKMKLLQQFFVAIASKCILQPPRSAAL